MLCRTLYSVGLFGVFKHLVYFVLYSVTFLLYKSILIVFKTFCCIYGYTVTSYENRVSLKLGYFYLRAFCIDVVSIFDHKIVDNVFRSKMSTKCKFFAVFKKELAHKFFVSNPSRKFGKIL